MINFMLKVQIKKPSFLEDFLTRFYCNNFRLNNLSAPLRGRLSVIIISLGTLYLASFCKQKAFGCSTDTAHLTR